MARPHRLNDSSYVGIRSYFLTICSHARSTPFTDATTVACTRDEFVRAAETAHQEILVYCLVASPLDYPHWGSQRHSREALLDFIASDQSDRRV